MEAEERLNAAARTLVNGSVAQYDERYAELSRQLFQAKGHLNRHIRERLVINQEIEALLECMQSTAKDSKIARLSDVVRESGQHGILLWNSVEKFVHALRKCVEDRPDSDLSHLEALKQEKELKGEDIDQEAITLDAYHHVINLSNKLSNNVQHVTDLPGVINDIHSAIGDYLKQKNA